MSADSWDAAAATRLAAADAVSDALVRLSGPSPSAPGRGADWARIVAEAPATGAMTEVFDSTLRLAQADVPQPVKDRLRQVLIRQAASTLRQIDQTHRLVDLLNRRCIPVSVLKGPPLAAAIYGDPIRRGPGDIDLLVPGEAVLDAVHALSEIGGKPRLPDPLLCEPRQIRRLTRASNDIEFDMPSGIAVELHWRWSRNPHLPPLDPARAWGAATVTLSGGAVPVPDPVEHLVYLCVHGARHRWTRLKWVNDLRWSLARPQWFGGDWSALVARARSLGVERIVVATLQMAAWLDRQPLPEPLRARRSDRAAVGAMALRELEAVLAGLAGRRTVPGDPRLLSQLAGLACEWRMTDGIGARWHGVLGHRLLAASERDLAMLDLPKPLEWLYPVLRPILWSIRQATRG